MSAHLLTHGIIHSTTDPYAQALLVRDGMIAWLGADEAGRGQMEGWLGDPALGEGGVAGFREILTSTGAVDEVEGEIARLVETSRAALAELEGCGVPREAVVALGSLVDLATTRTA